jgi:hypothetical protein
MQNSIMISRRYSDVNDAGSEGVKRMLSVIPEVSVQGEEDLLLFLSKGKNIRVLPPLV